VFAGKKANRENEGINDIYIYRERERERETERKEEIKYEKMRYKCEK